MKRSEMIKLMTDSWYEWVNTPKNIERYGLKAAHDNLLQKMEEAGMLPPTDIRSQSLVNGRRFRQLDMLFIDFTWEPEDEDN